MMLRTRTLLLLNAIFIGQLALSQPKTFDSLEEALEHQDSVEYVEISHLENEESLSVLSTFPRLKALRLTDYRGQQAPEFLSTLTQLSELQFINDDIESIPPSYANLVNLEKIEFVNDTHLDINQTMAVLNKLPKLTELRIEGLVNTSLFDSIHFPDHLKVLSLRNNHLSAFPSGVLDIKTLEILDIGDNDFYRLPKSLSSMSRLNTVFLDQQPVLQFDQTLEDLNLSSCLRYVYLGGNHLSPNSLKNLSHQPKYNALFDDPSVLLKSSYQPHIEWFNAPFEGDQDHLDGETSIKMNINKR